MTDQAETGTRDASAIAAAVGTGPDGFTTLQGLIWPEQGICTERDLYMRLRGPVGASDSGREIRFEPGGTAGFDTWFNLFNLGKWHRHCALSDLHLVLAGQGMFEVTVFLALPHRSWDRLVSEIVTLSGAAPLRLDMAAAIAVIGDAAESGEGVLFCEIRALQPGRLCDLSWQTRDAPRRVPELAIAITTFRREAAVQRTVARFRAHLADSVLADHVHLIVTDNGRSAEIAETPEVSLIGNENLGGAGGFARGLLAARDRGASHCLFMDDDASVHMASLDRSWMFLAYATDPATAIAGAMITAQHRWSIWENGALFHGRCRPLFMGTDLRDTGETFAMEFATSRPAPPTLYGGWWYFAFPVDRVQHMPFPFFVRGDDVSFSLVHDFNIVRLNGVVSFQDSFTDKESPLTWYLDLRSHMAHHLSLPALDVGALRTLKIAVWFFLRNLPRMHYETLAAINLALADVMQGPDFFDAHADMAQRRADIKALTVDEAWAPAPPHLADLPPRRKPLNWLARLGMKITLNGHLLPFYSRYGRRIVLRAEDRGSIGLSWGAAEITYLSGNRRQAYTVRHSKRRLLRESRRFAGLARRFLRDYDRLRDDWRAGYDRLTAEPYWRAKLHLTDPAPAPDPALDSAPEPTDNPAQKPAQNPAQNPAAARQSA
ncbi:glycosyltransferase family 2 protein [Sedimentitalea sp. HM32M-2]|uniref:glycosyltransferase family 2 protein n=1 Tax=Sedimentitalea sp. HM32M-2 TaxID=3351566 RepID=UPI0036416C45